MKNLQLVAVLFFTAASVNLVASYAKEDTSRSSKTVRNTPERPTAKKNYLEAAQVPKLAKPKVQKEAK